METKWLEDFVTLAQTKNFSKAANLRCVTQPAFSRRIQALEGWLGCELIDRGAYPTKLSPQGEVFYEQAISMLEQIRQTRTILRAGGGSQNRQQIRLVVPHTLAYTKVPRWIRVLNNKLSERVHDLSFQLTASNVHDAVLHFTDGGCDFLICFHHNQEPIELDPSKFEVRPLGVERFLPYTALDSHGKPLYKLDPLAPLPVPILAYAKHAYLSKMTDLALDKGPAFLKRTVFETDMSESLRAMCEAGLGVAWLPESAVIGSALLLPIPGLYQAEMELRLFRRHYKQRDANPMQEHLDMAWHVWPD